MKITSWIFLFKSSGCNSSLSSWLVSPSTQKVSEEPVTIGIKPNRNEQLFCLWSHNPSIQYDEKELWIKPVITHYYPVSLLSILLGKKHDFSCLCPIGSGQAVFTSSPWIDTNELASCWGSSGVTGSGRDKCIRPPWPVWLHYKFIFSYRKWVC